MNGPKKITYRIPKTGAVENREVKIETENFVGVACKAETKQMLQNLTNGPTKTEYKDEYYKSEDGTSVLISDD